MAGPFDTSTAELAYPCAAHMVKHIVVNAAMHAHESALRLCGPTFQKRKPGVKPNRWQLMRSAAMMES